jgi:hypothetical protein
MKNILKTSILFIILTILTQVGGFIYVFIKLILAKFFPNKSFSLRISFYLIGYLSTIIFIIPSLARFYGREPLPIFATKEQPIAPLRIVTCLMNRHYVKTSLKREIINISQKLSSEFPGCTITYLDGNFPIVNGFPLLPHLSHKDGNKLDIAFFYKSPTGELLNNVSPSLLGYGVCEEPQKGEYNYPKVCSDCGNDFKHNYLRTITPQFQKTKFKFDSVRTQRFLKLCVQSNIIKRIYLEPHLQTRLGFDTSNKIRRTGCNAVRHDDHIHIQL